MVINFFRIIQTITHPYAEVYHNFVYAFVGSWSIFKFKIRYCLIEENSSNLSKKSPYQWATFNYRITGLFKLGVFISWLFDRVFV